MINHCVFQANNTGVRVDGFNSLNIHLYSAMVDNNTNIGLDLSGGGSVHVYGGTWGRNAIGIWVATNASVIVSGVRDEGIAGSIFLLSLGSTLAAQVTIVGCDLQQVDATPAIQGIGTFTLIGNQFGNFANPVVPFLGNNSYAPGVTSLTMIGNVAQETTGLFAIDGNSAGMNYAVFNNIKLLAAGTHDKWDNESGTVDPTGPAKRAYFRSNSIGVVSADTITLEVNGTAPTVKYTTRFKTANTNPTAYTNFTNGSNGQLITVIVNDANSSFVNGATLATRTGQNVTAGNGLVYSFLLDGTVWRQVGSVDANVALLNTANVFTASQSVPTSAGTAVFGLDSSAGATITIANNATATPFGNANNFSGEILLNDTNTTGEVAMFIVGAPSGTVILLGQTASAYSTTVDTPGKINIYSVGSVVTIQNKLGSSLVLRVIARRSRSST